MFENSRAFERRFSLAFMTEIKSNNQYSKINKNCINSILLEAFYKFMQVKIFGTFIHKSSMCNTALKSCSII